MDFFGVSNVIQYNDQHQAYFGESSIHNTYKHFSKSFSRMSKVNKRNITMYCAGSTLGASRKPLSRNENNSFSMLPRPYKNNLPFSAGFHLLQQKWVCDFFFDIERLALDFIFIHLPKNRQSDLLKKMIILSKSQIPAELRICNTFFTQISLIGNMVSSNGEQCVDPHVDKDDLFTAIIHFGNPKKGGNLIIYGGNNKKSIGKKMKTHPFKHGNVHFGTFMDVVHSVDPWWGNRGSFSLNMKKSMIDFFAEQGNLQRYSCYRKLNYPNDDHFIIN